jgi:hypothetical protein
MRVRIKVTPRELELDGVRLDGFERGTVRDVSASIGSWLIAEGYAEPEMRHNALDEPLNFSGPPMPRDTADDHPQRRRNDPQRRDKRR